MKVLLMAAGESKRLLPLTKNIPKTLLTLNDKKILHHILDICQQCSLTDFHIISGHGHKEMQNFVDDYLKNNKNIQISLVYNEIYQTTGNIMSLFKAQHVITEDIIIINSDTIFHKEILMSVIQHPEKNVMAIDDQKKLSQEEMKVNLDKNKKITKIHKSLDPQAAHGEYIGVMKINYEHKTHLIDSLEQIIKTDSSLYYEDALQHFIDKGFTFTPVSTMGLPCMEIDTPEDLAQAKKLIKQITN